MTTQVNETNRRYLSEKSEMTEQKLKEKEEIALKVFMLI
jgi:hypothetical protein